MQKLDVVFSVGKKFVPRWRVEILGLRPGRGWIPVLESDAKTERGVWRDIEANGLGGYRRIGREFRITRI